MDALVSVKVVVPQELQRMVDALNPDDLQSIMKAVGDRVGAVAESLVSDYPPVRKLPRQAIYQRTSTAKKPYRLPNGTIRKAGDTFMSKFASQKQQGRVALLFSERAIPYRRTGTLGKSITSQTLPDFVGGVTVLVGTNVQYAPYVIGKTEQADYHKGNWTPLENDVVAGAEKVNRAASKVFVAELTKRMGG